MPTNKEIVSTVSAIAQTLIDDNGYSADISEYTKLDVSIGDNGCVNYSILCNGYEGRKPVKIYVAIKYDAAPEADKGHYEPDIIFQHLRVDDQYIIKETNAAYDRR